MEFKFSRIEGLVEIFPRIFNDERGYFLESYNKETFARNGLTMDFVQDNHSLSSKGVLRGLHLQNAPHAQGKLVRVIKGKVIDVVVDIRKNSKTFGEVASFILDDKRHNMLFVPEGFAHGFATFEESIFVYKCTKGYNKETESGILWNDPKLKIDWQVENPIVSDKDKLLPTFDELMNSI
jgi:dTDP-4-dehydrorhamnose 3,5-epimerase